MTDKKLPAFAEQIRELVYVKHKLGKVEIAVPSRSSPDPIFEEILTIPDLVCGAVTKYWSMEPDQKWGKYWEARAPIYKFLNEERSDLQKHCFYLQKHCFYIHHAKVQGRSAIEASRYKFELSEELQELLKRRSTY